MNVEKVAIVTDIHIPREDVEEVTSAKEALHHFPAHVIGIFTLSRLADYLNDDELTTDGAYWITFVDNDVDEKELDYLRDVQKGLE